MELQIWILSMICGALSLIVWWGVRRIIKKFDEIIAEVCALNEADIRQDGDIKLLTTCMDVTKKRVNDHAGRIKDLEFNQAKCKNFKTG